jgi:hypothetical protein
MVETTTRAAPNNPLCTWYSPISTSAQRPVTRSILSRAWKISSSRCAITKARRGNTRRMTSANRIVLPPPVGITTSVEL